MLSWVVGEAHVSIISSMTIYTVFPDFGGWIVDNSKKPCF